MRADKSGNHEKSSFHFGSREGRVTALADEMQRLAFDAAEPVKAGETIKAQMRRAWERLGRPPFWRVRAAWYGEAGCWSGEAIEDMRSRAEKRRQKVEAGRAEAAELGQIFADAADRMDRIDPHFHGPDIASLREVARALGAGHRAGAETGEAGSG